MYLRVVILTMVCVIFSSLSALGGYAYSGLPCKWINDSGGGDDKVGLVPDDRAAAKRDREIQGRLLDVRPLVNEASGAACFIERGDGRLLLLDPVWTKERP